MSNRSAGRRYRIASALLRRPHRRLLIRSVGRHHRIAAFVLLAMRFTYMHILSIAVAILRHFMLSSPQSRCAALCCRSAVTAVLLASIVAPLR